MIKFGHFIENIDKKNGNDDKIKVGDEIYTSSKKISNDINIGPTYTQYSILDLIEEEKTYTKAKAKIFSQVYINNDILYVYGIEDVIFYFYNEKNNDIREIKIEKRDYIILNNKKYEKYILEDDCGYLFEKNNNENEKNNKGFKSWIFYTLFLFLFFLSFLFLPYSTNYDYNYRRPY